MKTTTNVKDLTNLLWEAEDAGKILNDQDKIYVQSFGREFDEAMFTNKASWTRFVNKVDKEGIYYVAKKLAYKSKHQSITADGGNIIITYHTNPILVKTGYVIEGGIKKMVVSEVHKLTLELDFDWWWRRGATQANELEVTGKIIDFE